MRMSTFLVLNKNLNEIIQRSLQFKLLIFGMPNFFFLQNFLNFRDIQVQFIKWYFISIFYGKQIFFEHATNNWFQLFFKRRPGNRSENLVFTQFLWISIPCRRKHSKGTWP